MQVLSDLHLEHGGILPEHDPDADVIVLAGDLAPYTKWLIEHIAEHWPSAPHIIYVLGNHEFYGTEIEETKRRMANVSDVEIDASRIVGRGVAPGRQEI